jgi:hypothetical protein
MKDAQNSNEYEPTITDVIVAVQSLAETVQTGFERHEHLLTTLVEGQQNLREILNARVGDVEQRLVKTQNRVEDIAEMLEDNYEPRLKHLEEARV